MSYFDDIAKLADGYVYLKLIKYGIYNGGIIMGQLSQEQIADLFDEVKRLKKENIDLTEWKEKANNSMQLMKGIANSLEHQNELLKVENELLKKSIEQVKNTVANDVFAVLSQIGKEAK